MSRLFDEFRRRNVIRAAVTYVVAAWVLLQVIDLLAPALGWPDSATRITLYALLVGFPIALLLSWFYEITPGGISLDSDDDVKGSESRSIDHRLNLVVIALLGAAVILFAYDKWWPDHATDPSVAVLPFVNMSGLKENEYFSDGLTETLLHVLAQNAELRVISRTTAFKYKNRNEDVREIARELGVANVLEGSVQKIGDEIRITAQLIRASDGSHLWSRKYDRKLNDIFVIHDEIAESVSNELSRSLVRVDQAIVPASITTQDLEAFDLYLQAMDENRKGSFEAFQNAEELLKKALTRDPGFIEAKELLARNTANQFDTGAIDMATGIATATALYEQVLADDPDNVAARVFLIGKNVYERLESGDLAARVGAIEKFQALVEEAPNDLDARIGLAWNLARSSMHQAAIEQFKIAIRMDPKNHYPRYMLGRAFQIANDSAAARVHFEEALAIEPDDPSLWMSLGQAWLRSGDAVGFVRSLQRAAELDPLDHEMPYAISRLLYGLDLVEAGDQWRSRVTALAPDSPAAHRLTMSRAIRAETEAQSVKVARQLIRDDVDNRRGAWTAAFQHLMLTALKHDRVRKELNFIEEYWPHFGDFEIPQGEWKVGAARTQTLEIWRDLDTDEGVQQRVDFVEQGFSDLNLVLSRVPVVQIDVLLLRDDLEGAIEAALANLFSSTVLAHLETRDRFVTPLYAEFAADPRIADAFQRWEDEWAQAREDVRQYLAHSAANSNRSDL